MPINTPINQSLPEDIGLDDKHSAAPPDRMGALEEKVNMILDILKNTTEKPSSGKQGNTELKDMWDKVMKVKESQAKMDGKVAAHEDQINVLAGALRSTLENLYEGDGQEKAENDKCAAPQKKRAQLMPSSDMVLVGAKGQARMVARVGGTASKQDSSTASYTVEHSHPPMHF